MMCERALSRRTQGTVLAEKQAVQAFIADCEIELVQYRLMVLNTAWIIDTQPHGYARAAISMCKVAMAKVLHDIVQRALHVHGSLGTTSEMRLAAMWMSVPQLALADGPTEVHKVTVARPSSVTSRRRGSSQANICPLNGRRPGFATWMS
jgi:acyl-CoA dehydrogenase